MSIRRPQRGQAIVLVALFMAVLMGMMALLISAGTLYWERRLGQGLADAGALAGAAMVPCSASNAYAAVDGVISLNLGASPVLSQTPAGCASSTATSWSRTYPDGTQVAVTYPFVKNSDIQITVSRQVPLSLGSFLGAAQALVSARAVGRNAGASPPLNYAVYVQNGVTCGGSLQVDVAGSFYSGGSIDTNCSIYAHAIAGSDPGNVLVYPAGQVWSGGGSCTPGVSSGKAVCADGYEISANQCPIAGSTDFLASGQVDYPCPAWTVPQPSFSQYTSSDPNSDPKALATIGGTPCDPSGQSGAYPALTINGSATAIGRLRSGQSLANGTLVSDAPYKDTAGYYHFRPGCYGWLNVSLIRTADPSAKPAAVFDPGFYYFSGFFQPGDGVGTAGGLCLGSGTQVLGRDVLFEFTSSVKPSSLSTSSCDQVPSSSTSSSIGADPAAPVSDAGTTYGLLAAPCDLTVNPSCPLSGGSSWCPKTDRVCNALLIWAPPGPPVTTLPAINGTLFIKGPSATAWLYGTVFWPGSAGTASGCQWTANATVNITGQLLCKTLEMQGGSRTTASISYARTDTNSAPSQSGLVE